MTTSLAVAERDVRTDAGLRIVVSASRAPQIAVAVVVGSGSRADTADTAGLAHLVEHCTYRSDLSEDSRAHSTTLTAAGALFGASTYPDTTEFFLTARPDNLAGVLAAEARRLKTLSVRVEMLDLERNAIEEERAARAGARAADDLWVQHLRRHGAPGDVWHDGYGDAAGLSSLDLEDIVLFHREHYRADNIVVAIEAPSPDEALALARDAFEGIPGADAAASAVRVEQSVPTVVTAPFGPGVAASVAARVCAVADPDGYAAHLIVRAMLAPLGVSSAVGRHGPLSTGSPDLALAVAVQPDPRSALYQLRGALDSIAGAGDGAATDAARTRAGIDFALGLDAPVTRVRTRARTAKLYDRPDLFDRLAEALARCPRERIRSAARELNEVLP
ncbi:pitrilysin family protein [Microbacterium sp. BH-3-3-3]|uniref:M16 family metallopeptidase n=1 Tax=Microbacterium sp. BH-3-3-3 TaxID=1906742 RepID=UPI0008928533|nr:insulinase family protein [Microbacterium sp. BH-3-3-3]AOX46106.1 hypothetical protein BJP65_10045 [Microbacterium sp. BH-3-3-3]